MTEKTPPTDPLHKHLWAMSFDEKERHSIIEISKAFGPQNDPLALAAFVIQENTPPLPKNPWYARVRFWLRRKVQEIVLPRITKRHFKFEPRDLWIGVFWDVKDADRAYYVNGHMWWMIIHLYITIVPTIPLFVEVWFPRKKAKNV